MRLAAYTRVSTDAQVNDGYGLAVQQEQITRWAQSNGHTIAAWHQDAGESGADGLDKRHGLADALHTVAQRKARGIVVARLDRLARDLVLQETLIAECRKHGARVWSTAAGEDAYLEEIPDDPSRKMIRQILGAVAEYERGMIALRMAAGKARKVAEGGYAHGAPPYGWDAVDGRLEINELEQTQLAIMRTMRQGNASYRTICRVLNASGSRAKKGGPWHSNVVRRILDLDAARREETTTS